MGARSVTSTSKSKSKDCSTTCVATSTLPRRCAAVLSLPNVVKTRSSMAKRSARAKRAWNKSTLAASSPRCSSSARASKASSTELRM